MKQEQNALSILIPTYNYCCLSLVESLHAQATAQDGLSFEILVADDGSTDTATVTANRAISLAIRSACLGSVLVAVISRIRVPLGLLMVSTLRRSSTLVSSRSRFWITLIIMGRLKTSS